MWRKASSGAIFWVPVSPPRTVPIGRNERSEGVHWTPALFTERSAMRISLSTKIFLLIAGTALLTVVPALVIVARAVEDRVYERATQELLSAREALRTYWGAQDEALLEKTRRIALEPGLADPLLDGDTVLLRRILTSRVSEGRIILAADSVQEPLLGPAVPAEMVRAGSSRASIIATPPGLDVPMRVAFWEVWTDTSRAGVIGVGRPLDATALRDLKALTGAAEVALVAGDSVVATTLPDSLARVLQAMDLPVVIQRAGIWRRFVEHLPYLYSVSILPTHDGPAAILLLRPVADELRLARGIQESLFWIGAAAVLLSLILALLVARTVSRPAQVLAQAAAQLARGEFGAPLPPASGDEIGQLARAFAEMRSAIAEREARLRSAQAELIHREKLAAMGRLVAQLSHEINNPIYNIQNCLEALDRRGDPADPNREFLVLAQEELSRMAALTRRLLDQSRPLSDAAVPLSFNDIATRVALLSATEIESRGIELLMDLDPDLPPVVAHPDAIQQVVANLVGNAVDAMGAGGTLRIETSASSEAVELVVEDSGPGIDQEDLPHIFEAFYTTKPGVTGLGLGLFVSEGLVRGHRGVLTVSSSLGEGTRFVVRLPREVLDVGAALPLPHPDRATV
jgi:signal transduction histidine kinase